MKTKSFVFMGLLIALDIILARFLSISTPFLKIGFGFLPAALSGMLFGPLWGGVTLALADIMGFMIFPQGSYFPGFTFTAFVSGTIYGLYLYKRPKTILNIVLAILTVMLASNIGMNSLWLSILYHKAFIPLLVPRIIKNAIMLPIETVVIFAVWKYLGSTLESQFLDVKYDYR